MVKPIMVGFCCIRGWYYSGMVAVGFENACTVSGKWNEDVGSVQDFIFWFRVWCKTRELRSRVSPSSPCAIPVMESFPSGLLRVIISYGTKSHLESCQTCMMELVCENSQQPKDVDNSRKKCLTADIRLDSKCASEWKGALNVGFR